MGPSDKIQMDPLFQDVFRCLAHQNKPRFAAWWKPWTSDWTVAVCFNMFQHVSWFQSFLVPQRRALRWTTWFFWCFIVNSGLNRSVYSVMARQFYSHVKNIMQRQVATRNYDNIVFSSHTMSHSIISCVTLCDVVMSAKRWRLQSVAHPGCCQSCALMWCRCCCWCCCPYLTPHVFTV